MITLFYNHTLNVLEVKDDLRDLDSDGKIVL